MALFHPRKVSRLRAWLDARRGVKAGRPLPAYLTDKLAVAQRHAPRVGASPYALTIQGDGSVLRVPPNVVPPDPVTLPLDTDLRIKRGGAAAEAARSDGGCRRDNSRGANDSVRNRRRGGSLVRSRLLQDGSVATIWEAEATG